MAKYAAFGAKLQYDNSGWTDIAGIRDISGPGISGDTVDVTTHDSADAFREFLKVLNDGGEISFDLVWDPEDTAGQKKLLDEAVALTEDTYRVVFASTNSKTWEFDAFVTNFEPSQPVEGEISASVTMKVNGKPNFSPS